MMNNQPDPEIVLRLVYQALGGNRLAASQLSERHRRMVTATAYQALGNADDAADVAQEALVYAILRLPDLRDKGQFAAWVRHITLSRCIDYRRRRGTRRLGEAIDLLNEASEETNYVESLVVRQSLSHLSEAQRNTLLLHYEGGWSLPEVADLLAIPVNTVRSRLMAAKRRLRADLQITLETRKSEKTMLTTLPDFASTLDSTHLALLNAAFPGAQILAVQADPEPWMPFHSRVRLSLADGAEKMVDFRRDIDPPRAALLAVLERSNLPGPRLVFGPTKKENENGWLCLCEVPRGENLLLWALGGTPHRVRLATERAFEAIDRLQNVTPALLADPLGASLPRRTLADEADLILDPDAWNANPWYAQASADIAAWRNDPWFRAALKRARSAAQDIHDPLVFTNYLHFFPNGLRIQPAANAFDEPLGWPGDARYQENPLVEFVNPYGHLGDPLLGLAMVWVYDCYPFVHTGFVEQFLWRRNVSRREFAPRLAIAALQMIARDLPVTRPAAGAYWDSLRGWAEQALSWL